MSIFRSTPTKVSPTTWTSFDQAPAPQAIVRLGSFKMSFFVRTGICVPANGSTFARAKFSGVSGLLAETALTGDNPAEAVAVKCRHQGCGNICCF